MDSPLVQNEHEQAAPFLKLQALTFVGKRFLLAGARTVGTNGLEVSLTNYGTRSGFEVLQSSDQG